MTKKPNQKRKRSTTAAGPAHPPSLQVGALCWRRGSKGMRILLVTSRDTGRWVIPKGWPMRNRTEAEAAAREAYEEAGVGGEVDPRSIGFFSYRKRLGPGRAVQCLVRVFPLKVSEMLTKYPETGERRVRWFPPEKAARRVNETDLAELIRDFDPDRRDPVPAGPEPAEPAEAEPAPPEA